MRIRDTASESDGGRTLLHLARVLLLHSQLAPRLALRTILQAGGYFVDIAATPFEALARLDDSEYDLVLADAQAGTQMEEVLAYARVKNYRPATAIVSSVQPLQFPGDGNGEVAIHTEDVPLLLGQVADLIAARASRRYRPTRFAGRA